MRSLLGLLLGILAGLANGSEVAVAVAANFAAPMKELLAGFESQSGHRVLASFGSTGKFYAQIRNGAPFDVLLAADEQTPDKLVGDGVALANTRRVYATGRLALWSAKPELIDPQGSVLRTGSFRHLAIANPRLAPYGQAALETLDALHLRDQVQARLVQGENIAQTHQFVASGAAEIGFVALSQIMRKGVIGEGSAWVVPSSYHRPIRQAAVVLARGKDNPAATGLVEYLGSPEAKALIKAYGYDVAE